MTHCIHVYQNVGAEVCPHCGDELWHENGYWSYYEMLLFEGFYYKWDMNVSHYR